MLHAIALIPHPPVLIRELSGTADVVPDLRAAAGEAVRTICAGAESVLVIGGDERTRPLDANERFDPGRYAPALRASEVPATGAPTRPVSIEVAARALHGSGWTGVTTLATVGWHANRTEVEELLTATEGDHRVALVVAGDGSARRDLKTPGHFDQGAIDTDDILDTALMSNDAEALLALDDLRATELLIPGRAAMWVLAMALRRRSWEVPTVHYLGDPFGVRYRVMSWLAKRSSTRSTLAVS